MVGYAALNHVTTCHFFPSRLSLKVTFSHYFPVEAFQKIHVKYEDAVTTFTTPLERLSW